MIASALLLLAIAGATMYYVSSYRPTRVPVVERARVPRDVRAKVSPDALMRMRLERHRRTARNIPTRHTQALECSPTPTSAGTATIAAPVLQIAPPVPQPIVSRSAEETSQPDNYFGPINAPSPETITSDVRGPWAAKIVTGDGRITLPDNGMDVAATWRQTEQAPPAGSYLS